MVDERLCVTVQCTVNKAGDLELSQEGHTHER